MADIWNKQKRSQVMSHIRSSETKPEIIVRSLIHKMGYRFRLHRRDLPGNPDIVLPKYKSIIFVHGCFWHQHQNCRDGTLPKTNKEYWHKKLKRNIDRDKSIIELLQNMGWRVLVIWECEVNKSKVDLKTRVENFLRQGRVNSTHKCTT